MKSYQAFIVLSFIFLFSTSVFTEEACAAGQKKKVSEPTAKNKVSKSTAKNETTLREPASEEIVGLYKAKCASCHGAQGEGSPKMEQILKVEEEKLLWTGKATKKALDIDLLKTLLAGKRKMPGFKGKISDGDAQKLLKYMRAFGK